MDFHPIIKNISIQLQYISKQPQIHTLNYIIKYSSYIQQQRYICIKLLKLKQSKPQYLYTYNKLKLILKITNINIKYNQIIIPKNIAILHIYITMQKQKDSKMCKIHSQRKGQFYIQKQPWNKLCKQCALNRAVCGYKIQKEMSVQQFQNKIILASLIEQLKLTIEKCQRTSTSYSAQIELIKNKLVPFVVPIIKQIDNYMNQLNIIRNSLAEMSESYINQKITKLQESQGKYYMESLNFKNYLQRLQDNYCDIIIENNIKNQGEQIFTNYVQEVKVEIQKNRKFMAEEQGSIDQKQIERVKGCFKDKFMEFGDRSLHNKLGKILVENRMRQSIQSRDNCNSANNSNSKKQRQSISQRQSLNDQITATTLVPDKLGSFTSRAKLWKNSTISSSSHQHNPSSFICNNQQNKNPIKFHINSVSNPKNTPSLTLKCTKRNNSIPPKDTKFGNIINKIGGNCNGIGSL